MYKENGQQTAMVSCEECGQSIPAGAKFCPYCGMIKGDVAPVETMNPANVRAGLDAQQEEYLHRKAIQEWRARWQRQQDAPPRPIPAGAKFVGHIVDASVAPSGESMPEGWIQTTDARELQRARADAAAREAAKRAQKAKQKRQAQPERDPDKPTPRQRAEAAAAAREAALEAQLEKDRDAYALPREEGVSKPFRVREDEERTESAPERPKRPKMTYEEWKAKREREAAKGQASAREQDGAREEGQAQDFSPIDPQDISLELPQPSDEDRRFEELFLSPGERTVSFSKDRMPDAPDIEYEASAIPPREPEQAPPQARSGARRQRDARRQEAPPQSEQAPPQERIPSTPYAKPRKHTAVKVLLVVLLVLIAAVAAIYFAVPDVWKQLVELLPF